jgi:hypothetical protein
VLLSLKVFLGSLDIPISDNTSRNQRLFLFFFCFHVLISHRVRIHANSWCIALNCYFFFFIHSPRTSDQEANALRLRVTERIGSAGAHHCITRHYARHHHQQSAAATGDLLDEAYMYVMARHVCIASPIAVLILARLFSHQLHHTFPNPPFHQVPCGYVVDVRGHCGRGESRRAGGGRA